MEKKTLAAGNPSNIESLNFSNEAHDFFHAMGCRFFDFRIGVNHEFFARNGVAMDPRVVIVVALLHVFHRDGFALAASFRDALHARLGIRANVDEASNRQVAHKLVKPHGVNDVLVVRNVAAVIQHFGEDVAVGVHAALGNNDATAPGMLANRLA